MKNHTVENQFTVSFRMRVAFILALTLHSFAGRSQQVARTPSGLRNIAGYYEHLPAGYNSGNKKYPLLVFCHGVGELAGQNGEKPLSLVLKNGVPKLIEEGRFPASFTVNNQSFSFIVITPQFKWWPGSNDVHDLISHLKKQYRVDENRIYLTGISMGGGVVWGAISEVPARARTIAAAAVVCGAYDPNANKQLAKTIAADNTPVWALHNDGDPTVNPQYSRDWVSQINAAQPAPNPKARLTMFANARSHNAWSRAYDPNYRENGMNVYEWMLQYSLQGSGTTPGNRRITVPATSGQAIYFPNVMADLDVKPGDTLCIPAGEYQNISLGKVVGTADKPVVITNCGGQVKVGIRNQSAAGTWLMGESKYFKIEGTGTPGIEYGFDINGTDRNGTKIFGMTLGAGSSDFEVHHVYLHDCGMFLVAKTLQECGHPEWLEGAFVMRNVKLHHLKGRNSAYEGFYIGNTHYLWDDGSCKNMKSHHIENLQVYDNDLENVGSDGIQISMASMGENKVYNNRLVNYGMTRNSAHGYGILVGGGSKLNVFNNKISTGYGPAVQVFGTGVNRIYNNLITNIESEGVCVADKDLFEPPAAYIYNNTIVKTGYNAIKIYAYKTTLGHRVYNNLSNVTGTPYDYPEEGLYIKGDKPIKLDYGNNLNFKDIQKAGFVNSGSDYHLAAQGPAVNAGRNMSDLNLTTDIEGRARPQGGKYDVGAYEYQQGVANVRPTANAGKDTSTTLPVDSLLLDGSASRDQDGRITAYAWKQASGPAAAVFSSTTIDTPRVRKLVAGTYVFELVVTDNQQARDTDRVTVTVHPEPANQSPVAKAGRDTAITLPVNSITLDGSASYDPDGNITAYNWKKVSGPAGASFNANTATTRVDSLVAGVYVFELKVTDDRNGTATDRVTVTVQPEPNDPPIADAGRDTAITLPVSSIILDGSASHDPDGSITAYSWTKVSGPAGAVFNRNTATTRVDSLAAGTYIFELKVTDNKNATATDRVTITVHPEPANQQPVALAGQDTTITLPVNSIILDGSASYDPDGSITAYNWKKVSGPAGASFNANTATTRVDSLVAGTYLFELKVTDNRNGTATDRITITVQPEPNEAPIANAGKDTAITLPLNSITLDGNASYDPDGHIAVYKWKQVSGPAGASFNSTLSAPKVSNLVEGTYVFELTVTDNKDAAATDQVTVTVHPEPANQLPVAIAGNDTTVALPASALLLNGSASYDPDGSITAYHWKLLSGPSAATFNNTAAATQLGNLVVGTYMFELTVTDNKTATATDQVSITVQRGAQNQPPVPVTQGDITITQPVEETNADGRRSYDPDGSISRYHWTQVSGPGIAIIWDPYLPLTRLSNLYKSGTYKFQLTVTDNEQQTSSSVFTVQVNQKVPTDSVYIYPNPTTNFLRLNVELKSPTNVRVIIRNLVGVMKRDLQYSNTQLLQTNIDVSDLPWGYYVIEVTGSNGFTWSKTFMKALE